VTLRWQPAILEPVPALARYLEFDLQVGTDPVPALGRLSTGGYYWCPPVDASGHLDLSILTR
jgi:hypothetical protein